MPLINIFCETCRERVAIIDTTNFVFPLTGSMFLSPDPFHGITPPFEPHHTWELMFCPHGRKHRISDGPDYIVTDNQAKLHVPTYEEVIYRGREEEKIKEGGRQEEEIEIVDNGVITTTDGEVEVVEVPEVVNQIAPAVNTDFLCRICGKQFNSRFALTGHSRSHKPGELK
jgi:hypothetical protein